MFFLRNRNVFFFYKRMRKAPPLSFTITLINNINSFLAIRHLITIIHYIPDVWRASEMSLSDIRISVIGQSGGSAIEDIRDIFVARNCDLAPPAREIPGRKKKKKIPLSRASFAPHEIFMYFVRAK